MKTLHVVAAIIRQGEKIFATQRGYGEHKDKWEFPGGKVEPGESPESALIREIKEELDADITITESLTTVEYDYPEFHLSMDCFMAELKDGSGLKLKEHEAARWLSCEELDSVDWLPADIEVVKAILRTHEASSSDIWRQALHLEPPTGWMNDPNGLCYAAGKYHVFFQYTPEVADGSGLRRWGHYESSDDGRSWEFTGTFLSPDIPEDRTGVFSGSAVNMDGVIHIFYTGNVELEGDYDYVTSGREANQIHVISADGRVAGPKNVILRNSDYPNWCSCHVRDPKVWIDEGRWKMVLGARTLDDKGCVLFYEAADPEHWTYVSLCLSRTSDTCGSVLSCLLLKVHYSSVYPLRDCSMKSFASRMHSVPVTSGWLVTTYVILRNSITGLISMPLRLLWIRTEIVSS